MSCWHVHLFDVLVFAILLLTQLSVPMLKAIVIAGWTVATVTCHHGLMRTTPRTVMVRVFKRLGDKSFGVLVSPSVSGPVDPPRRVCWCGH